MKNKNLLLMPIKAGKHTIKNRMFFCGMPTGYEKNDGSLSPRSLAFYQRLAQGGAGYIVLGGMSVLPSGKAAPGLYTEKQILDLAHLTEHVHEYGAKLGVQIYYPEYDLKKYTKLQNKAADSLQKLQASKMMQCHKAQENLQNRASCSLQKVQSYLAYEKTHFSNEASSEQLQDMQTAILEYAAKACSAGVDAIEIDGSGLLGTLTSKQANQRQDQYGQSFENRIRFVLETIGRIRTCFKNVMLSYKIHVQLSDAHAKAGAMLLQEVPAFAQALEKAGIDLIHIAPASDFDASISAGEKRALCNLGKELKENLFIPAAISGLDYQESSSSLIKNKKADLLGFSRSFLADPDLPNKILEEKPVRACLSCQKGCIQKWRRHKPISCVVNPENGYEHVRSIEKSPAPKKVAVVGATLTGLEAARVAALRGHSVKLFDDGALSQPENTKLQKTFAGTLSYYQKTLDLLGVEIHSGNIDSHLPEEFHTAIISKVKSAPCAKLQGSSKAQILMAEDVLDQNAQTENLVAVIGNSYLAMETALYLAAQKKEVYLISSGTVCDFSKMKAEPKLLKEITQLSYFTPAEFQKNGVWLRHTLSQEEMFLMADTFVYAQEENTDFLSLAQNKTVYLTEEKIKEEQDLQKAIRAGYLAAFKL
jgi:2,4-dienoyl-CoA reductase-like NADH-dependent reductase (Old Yellow Enzyme family)